MLPLKTAYFIFLIFTPHHAYGYDSFRGKDTLLKSMDAPLQTAPAFEQDKKADSVLIKIRAAENRYKLTSLFLIPGVIVIAPSAYLLVKSIQFIGMLLDNLNNHQSEAPGIDILLLIPAALGVALGAVGIAGSTGRIIAGTISIHEYIDCRKKEMQLSLVFDFPLR